MSNSNDSHHCIATSIGGSDHDVNVVDDVFKPAHRKFHQWGENRPPCMNMRMAALNSVGGEHTMPPDSLKTLLEITTMYRWTDLYHPSAFASVADPCSIKRSTRSSEFQLTHWLEELTLVRKLMHALTNGKHFPVNDGGRSFHSSVITSMNVQSIQEALLAVLTAEKCKKLVWINPMHGLTRADLLDCVEHAKPMSKPETSYNELHDVLSVQKTKLDQFIAQKRRELEAVLGNGDDVVNGQ